MCNHSQPSHDAEELIQVVRLPALDGCPECQSDHLEGVRLSREGVSLRLDRNGGVAHQRTDQQLVTTYSSLSCFDCGATLIEDGKIVHDALIENTAEAE